MNSDVIKKVKIPVRPKVDSGLSRILDDPRVNTGRHRTILVENSIGYGHRIKPQGRHHSVLPSIKLG